MISCDNVLSYLDSITKLGEDDRYFMQLFPLYELKLLRYGCDEIDWESVENIWRGSPSLKKLRGKQLFLPIVVSDRRIVDGEHRASYIKFNDRSSATLAYVGVTK